MNSFLRKLSRKLSTLVPVLLLLRLWHCRQGSQRLVLIADIVKETSASAVTASQYSQTLEELANDLEQSVEQFTTDAALGETTTQ